MKLLITGGAGFIGTRLARTILAKGRLNGKPVKSILLADQFPAQIDLVNDKRVNVITGPLLNQCSDFAKTKWDGVFHLASAVSGECEADFDLGMRSNLESTRALLEALRSAGNVPRILFSSSSGVFGPDPAHEFPFIVTDTTLPTPQTSYGVQKLMCEYLIADYTRKGFIDGRSARLMTVTVRPGKPNGAASSFFSGIIREPLAGEVSICPVDETVAHPIVSPSKTVEALIRVFEASSEEYVGRSALNLPALNVTVAQMLQALEDVAGPKVRALVQFKKDARIASIVDNWPRGATGDRAISLGLVPDTDFKDVIREYIADCKAAGLESTALKGLIL